MKIFGIFTVCASLFFFCFSFADFFKKRERLLADCLVLLKSIQAGIWMEESPKNLIINLQKSNLAAAVLAQEEDVYTGLVQLCESLQISKDVTSCLKQLLFHIPTVKEEADRLFSLMMESLEKQLPSLLAKNREGIQLCLRLGGLSILMVGIILL